MLTAWMVPIEVKLYSHPRWYQHLPIQQQEEEEELFYGMENKKYWGGGGGVVLYDIDITGALSVHFLSPLTPTHKYMFMGQ